MARYKEKVQVVDAVQLTVDNAQSMGAFSSVGLDERQVADALRSSEVGSVMMVEPTNGSNVVWYLLTEEGLVEAESGDWRIVRADGSIVFCSAEKFGEEYEPA